MALTLSHDPITQQTQLKQLIEKSQQYLTFLKSPIIMFHPNELWSKDCTMWGKNKTCQDYVPPPTRFGKFSKYK